jgi:hypothetical protein
MTTPNVRALLAVLTLVSVIVAAGLAFFLGPHLSDVQLTLLTMLLTSLIGKLSTAFTYFFDGTPKTPEAP